MGGRRQADSTAPDEQRPSTFRGNFRKSEPDSGSLNARANTVAHSAGAVCCLTERDACRSDRCGWRATWWELAREVRLAHQDPRHALRSIPERREMTRWDQTGAGS